MLGAPAAARGARTRRYHLGVAPTASRYDPVADWYVDYSEEWPVRPLALLPDRLDGLRVVDLACGPGRSSRYLAALGADVTAVDLSANLLRVGQSEPTPGVRHVLGDVTTTDWWDGRPFHGAVCNLALMDIDDLAGAFRSTARVLAAGGWFTFSLLHPCYPGVGGGGSDGLSSWPPERGYSAEGWWNTNGIGVRGHVGANHRMLSTYLNAALAAGFELVEFAEPADAVPRFWVARCRRPGRAGSLASPNPSPAGSRDSA